MTDADGTAKQPLLGDCASAFLLLSRIPVTWHSFPDDRPPDFISSLWAFPLVGLVIGGGGGLVMLAGQVLALPPVITAIGGFAVMVMMSGAMHEDGLADMADGFGGGRDSESKVRIMHDSRIGSYGVLALILAVAMRIGLYISILAAFKGLVLVTFMAVIQATARFQPVLQLSAFRISPHASLAQLTGRPGTTRLAVSALLCLVPLAWLLGPVAAAVITFPGLAVSVYIGRLATRHVEGLTGDVMGATIILAEIIMLVSWTAIAGTIIAGTPIPWAPTP